MLLNFWRGWREGWERYCSRVFHQHSDQYHQILNMRRNHSFWRAAEEERTKPRKPQDLLPRMLTEKKNRGTYQKWLEAWGILTRLTQTLWLFIPCSSVVLCFVDISSLVHASSLPDTRKQQLCCHGRCQIINDILGWSILKSGDT